MSKLAAAKVVFRRIRGRIVPIPVSGKDVALIGGGGAVAGASFGSISAAKQNRRDMAKITKDWKNPKTSVETKKFVKQIKFKNVTVITNLKDLYASKLKPRTKRAAEPLVIMAQAGRNAFAGRIDKQDVIIASKRAPKSVIGHELGHIRDFRKRGKPGFFQTGLIGTLTGATYEREKRAWKLSPSKDRSTQKKALGTYERTRDRTRAGAALGFTAGIAAKILSKGRL